MGVKIFRIAGYCCDKCGHTWAVRKKGKGEEIPKPKICPKCKTKKWNYLNISSTDSMSKKLLQVYKEKYGKKVADFTRETFDLKFKKKRLIEDITNLKKDLSNPSLSKDKKFIESTKDLIKEFEEMLKDLEKIK